MFFYVCGVCLTFGHLLKGFFPDCLTCLFMVIVLTSGQVGYHTESRCQYQPASFSSAFKLSGTACLVGVGVGGGAGGVVGPTQHSCVYLVRQDTTWSSRNRSMKGIFN